MDTPRISELLEPFLLHPLTSVQLEQISTYIDLLLRWNTRTNLTAIRSPEEIVTRHFGESLFAAQTLYPEKSLVSEQSISPARVGADALVCPAERSSAEPAGPMPPTNPVPRPFPRTFVIPTEGRDPLSAETAHLNSGSDLAPKTKRPEETPDSFPEPIPLIPTLDLLDLGSGAGFPGMPIHLWTPTLKTVLLESNQKKVAFLREVIRALTLTDINVFPGRAEDFRATANTVTLRAVERFDQTLPIAARLVAPQGRLALLIAEPQAAKAKSALPLSWHPPISVPESTSRILLIGTAQPLPPQQ